MTRDIRDDSGGAWVVLIIIEFDNPQGDCHLTDVVETLLAGGRPEEAVVAGALQEVLGTNDPIDPALAEKPGGTERPESRHGLIGAAAMERDAHPG